MCDRPAHLASPAQTQPKAPLALHRLRFLADLNATTAEEAARELAAYAPRDAMETALAEQIITLRAVLRHFATRALGPHSSPAMALRALSAVSSLQRVLLSTQSALDRRQRKPLPEQAMAEAMTEVTAEATAEATADIPRDPAHPEPASPGTARPAASGETEPVIPGETEPPLPEPDLARRLPAFAAELAAAPLSRDARLIFARAPIPRDLPPKPPKPPRPIPEYLSHAGSGDAVALFTARRLAPEDCALQAWDRALEDGEEPEPLFPHPENAAAQPQPDAAE